MSATTRNCCVLFADVAGSTRLYEVLGDAEALRAIDRCLNRVERAVVASGGKVVKTIGDELMATFVNTEMAAHAAMQIQSRVDGLPPVLGNKLAIRIGFHYGSVLTGGGDVFGNTVNVAARITEVSGAREIITSAETALLLPKALQEKSLKPRDSIRVKGKSSPLEIVELVWGKGAEAAMKSAAAETPKKEEPKKALEASTLTPRGASVRVVLHYGDQKILLRGEAAKVTLGRDPVNDIVIGDPRASRSHAVIELRDGECFLVDKSSNGSYVQSKEKGDFVLRHETAPLSGKGSIYFGHVPSDTEAHVLSFEVQKTSTRRASDA